ncbi:ABC transporter ATP-binding protein [Jiella sp. MQZ9-1]|uniref:Spermidine/putrescine import ATP-binding protein PotA n=1 Tax=Jiella flava TaxID=2816857 RepID=A0A939JVS7_9HYPH|nr:ABC transporter ATP-binding protein [Jiella flava]MBO0661566.1 ABC transporter ATP-binding protein [Jiella flava]MCD2470208.1 ABC transporter ATP-binding protein [Jiella flava]
MKSLGSIRNDFAPWREPQAQPFIRFEAITKRFGQFNAVDDLSLSIFKGEFFALLGASGCGKSTLLRMLAGFETPTSGRVILDGDDLAGIPPYRRPVNMMFQSYALFPHMSVAKNIAFGLKREGMPKGEIAARVEQVLKLVKLQDYARRRPDQLSGGQRQRVALARSLAKRPKVLLLDEPLGALDKKLREETQFELTDLQYELGTTFIMVTHDQEEAMTMADRIAVMDKGRIVQVATPAEIYEAPKSRFVADFVGDVNLFDGTVQAVDRGRITLQTSAGSPFTVTSDVAVSNGQAVTFVLRPEKLRIAAEPLSGANVLEGEVWDIAYVGPVTSFHIRLANGAVVKVAMINATRESPLQLTWHDRAWLQFDEDAGLVLTA